MIKRLPIGVRLTIWYSLVLAVALLCFSSVVWLGLRNSLIAARRSELSEGMRQVEGVLRETAGHREVPAATIREELEEFSLALPSDVTLRVWDSSGGTVFVSGDRVPADRLQDTGVFGDGARRLRFEVSVSLDGTNDILNRLLHIFLLSAPVVLLGAGAGGYWLAQRALAPVREMARAAESIHPADLSIRLPVPEALDDLRVLTRMWNEMLARLQAGVERMQRFTSDASHDLRTPVATIRASAEIALRKTRTVEAYEETLRGILRQAERATKLIEDLLTLTRADQAEAGFRKTAVDAGRLAAATVLAMQPLAGEKRLLLTAEVPEEPVFVRADEAALTRVLEILLDNAIRYTEAGAIAIAVTGEGAAVQLRVTDTGCGVEEADLPHIFERFYRGDTSRVGGGSGLGLAIAKELVELHGGEIGAESVPGEGSAFTVRMGRVFVSGV